MKEEYINLSVSNLADEHICCAFSDKKCARGYLNKKQLLAERIEEGYVFLKLDVRGKVFIEYCPVEIGWLPINAVNAMLINCFWVSGKFKGKGHAKYLLNRCIHDARSKGMKSILAVSSDKKQPFMTDGKFLRKFGFRKVDAGLPYFELLQLDLEEGVQNASFKEIAKQAKCDIDEGLVVYYTDACPFNDYYVNVVLKGLADQKNIPLHIKHIVDRNQAQSHFVPHTLYSLFYNGKFVTQQVLSEKSFVKILPGVN